MFKSTKKLQKFYDEQELGADSSFYLSDKDRQILQKKAKKEIKRASGKRVRRNESEW